MVGRHLVVLAIVLASCGGTTAAPPAPSPAVAATASQPAASPTASPTARPIAAVLEGIDPAKLNDHMVALASFGSRDVRNPQHAKAVAYLKEQLGAINGITVRSHFATYQSLPLENILAFIDPAGSVPDQGWVMICAHYDSISNRTPGWNPATM